MEKKKDVGEERWINRPYNIMLFVVMAEVIAVLNHLEWVVQHVPLLLLILICNVIILWTFRMLGKKKRSES